MTKAYVAAIDQGTTSSRCMIFDAAGAVAASAQVEHRQIFPRPGWVEHDAQEIWANVSGVTSAAMAKLGIGPADLAAVGITNQRETTLVWEKATGRPIANAIVWQDTRTAALVAEARRRGWPGPIPRDMRPAARHLFLRARSCAGCWTTSMAPRRRRPAASCCSAPWTAG